MDWESRTTRSAAVSRCKCDVRRPQRFRSCRPRAGIAVRRGWRDSGAAPIIPPFARCRESILRRSGPGAPRRVPAPAASSISARSSSGPSTRPTDRRESIEESRSRRASARGGGARAPGGGADRVRDSERRYRDRPRRARPRTARACELKGARSPRALCLRLPPRTRSSGRRTGAKARRTETGPHLRAPPPSRVGHRD
jgi:hypothetical protein